MQVVGYFRAFSDQPDLARAAPSAPDNADTELGQMCTSRVTRVTLLISDVRYPSFLVDPRI